MIPYFGGINVGKQECPYLCISVLQEELESIACNLQFVSIPVCYWYYERSITHDFIRFLSNNKLTMFCEGLCVESPIMKCNKDSQQVLECDSSKS